MKLIDGRKCDIPKAYCSVRDKNGCCTFGLNYRCQPVIDKCKEGDGCERIENGYCKAYIFPALKWKHDNCPLATHIKSQAEIKKEEMKRRVGQQKQKKRK